MKRKIIILFVLLLLNVSYSRQIQIPIHFENSPTTIELYNIKGQRVFSQEFSRYTGVPFPLSNNLSNQVYVMRVKNGASEFTRKFTPNHKIQFTGSWSNIGRKQLRNEDSDNVLSESNSSSIEPLEPVYNYATNVIFINGVWNTRDEANENRRRIERAYNSSLLADPKYKGEYKFTLGYNHTRGKPDDIVEAISQIIDMDFSTNSKEKETLDSLKKITDKSFENRERVVILSHSQGNIYADKLFESFSIQQKSHTAVLNIATPTTKPTTGRWYFTSHNDRIINATRILNSRILPGLFNDVLLGEDPRDSYFHNFWESYFSPNLASRASINSEFFYQCSNLPFWEIGGEKEIFYDSTEYRIQISLLESKFC